MGAAPPPEGFWGGPAPPQDFEKNMAGCLSLRGNEREEEDENSIHISQQFQDRVINFLSN